MESELNLRAKLLGWLRAQSQPISIVTVFETGDSELASAYVVAMFELAAGPSGINRCRELLSSHSHDVPKQALSKLIQLFDGLSRIWFLSTKERAQLLGLRGKCELSLLQNTEDKKLNLDTIGRIATLLDIFTALNVLLPSPHQADQWIRKRNSHSLFAGKEALEVMASGEGRGSESVRRYLWGQI